MSNYPINPADAIDLVERLNHQMWEACEEQPFSYTTDGTHQAILLDETSLWDDAEDPRQYDDNTNDYEPLEPFVRKAAREHAERIILGIESPFKAKNDLIEKILAYEKLVFQDDMTEEERERMDVERQSFVLRMGFNQRSISELRRTVKRLG